MRYMHISALVLAVAVGFSAPALVRADDSPTTQPTTRPRGEHREFNGPIISALKATTPAITDDERAKIKPILEAARQKFEAWRSAHKGEFQQLRTDLKAAHDAGDTDKVAQLTGQMRDLFKDAPKPKEVVDQILPLLTADQQTSFKAALESYRKEHGRAGAMGGGLGLRNRGAAAQQ
jgi:Spy/CpxP family protein refolding chaperone